MSRKLVRRWLVVISTCALLFASVAIQILHPNVSHAAAPWHRSWGFNGDPTARYDLMAATGRDGNVYAIGGFDGTNALSIVEASPVGPNATPWACSTNDTAPLCSSTNLAPMPTARYAAAAVVGPDAVIYVIGGTANGSTPLAVVEAYDPTHNTWACSVGDTSTGCATTTLAPMPTARFALGGALGSDGGIYVIGGTSTGSSPLATVQEYMPSINSWASAASLPTARFALAGAAGADGRIYALGGTAGGSTGLATVEAYTPGTNTWASVASMPHARFWPGAATGVDGQIMVVGGTADGATYVINVEAYNPSTNTWEQREPLDAGVGAAMVLGPDRHLDVLDGYVAPSAFADVSTYDAADPATGYWASTGSMSVAHEYLTAATGADGRVYSFGGYDGTAVLNDAEVYNNIAGTWAALPAMPTARENAGTALGRDRRIYVIGGDSGSSSSLLQVVEAYDPRSNTWACSVGDTSAGCASSTLAPLPTPRNGDGVAAGPDGRIYVVGGGTNVLEVYDPLSNTWACSTGDGSTGCGSTTLAPWPQARTQLAATAGSDGRIYTLGGATGGTQSSFVEAYDPSANTWACSKFETSSGCVSSTLPQMDVPRAQLAAASGPDGRIYAVGGMGNSAFGGANEGAETYTPGDANWVEAPQLLNNRIGSAAAFGGDGRLYAIGGQTSPSGALLNAVERYIPTMPDRWYFAEGFTGSGFTTYLTLANPDPATTIVTVQYLLGSGSPISKTYNVPGYSRATVNVNNEVGPNQNVSMLVTADGPIVAERPMYFTFNGIPGLPVSSGTDTLGSPALGTTFYFGDLAILSGFKCGYQTYLTILNPNNSQMNVSVQYYAGTDGSLTTRMHTVSANSRGTINVNKEGLTAPNADYSAIVTLSEPGLVERPMYVVDCTTKHTGAADVMGVPNPFSAQYFAEGYTGAGFREVYVLANPSAASANATVTFAQSNGTTTPVNASLGPGQQQGIIVNFALGDGLSNSAVMTTDQPILAERQMSFNYTGPVTGGSGNIQGFTDSLGTASPSSLFAFAEGFNGIGFAEYLTLENPSATQTAYVTVVYLPTKGSPVMATYTVNPHSRNTVYAWTTVPGLQSFSMLVTSTLPIVAERPMYFEYKGSIPGGTDVVGFQP